MNTLEMDKDLSTYNDFDKLSDRVSYWRRRLARSSDKEELAERFDEVVAKHSLRVVSLLRAG